MKRIDLVGQRFGRLLVVSLHSQDKYNRLIFSCICDCGKSHVVSSNSLRTGKSKSCGCFSIDRVTKHGHSKRRSKEYNIYYNMIQRCNNKLFKQYSDYGGRGINVCNRWLGDNGFLNFLSDMGECPSTKHSLDRYPNTNGNYEKENCRWATEHEQKRNTRRNVWFELPNKKVCMKDMATVFGVPYQSIQSKIKSGQSKEQIVNFYIKKYGYNDNI